MTARPAEPHLIAHGPVTVELIGSGAGPLVVFAPSLGRGARDFAEVGARLAADGFRVLRPQPRGAGRSSGPMESLSYHDWAADLALVIEHEQSGPAVVVGHAAGSRYARACAADHPDLVCGVVVAASSANRPVPQDLSTALARSADLSLPDGERLAAMRTAFFAHGHDPAPWLEGWFPTTERSQRATIESGDWYGAGDTPLLDLHAEHDPWRPAATRTEMRDALGTRVQTAVIAGAGHALFPEQPAAVATAVADWIRQL